MAAAIIETWHDGVFLFNPLRYSNGKVLTIVMARTSYNDLVEYLEKETGSIIAGMYYLLDGNTLESGIGLEKFKNENDCSTLFDLVESGYNRFAIYIDHFDGDLSPYLNKELVNIDTNEGAGKTKNQFVELGEVSTMDVEIVSEEEDDNDLDSIEGGHFETASVDNLSEGEDEIIELRKGKGKSLKLTKDFNLPIESKNKEDDDDDGIIEHEQFMEHLRSALQKNEKTEMALDEVEEVGDVEEYPIHDESTHWRLKKPLVGEKYENNIQLKDCLTHYSLANGFSIWYERSSKSLLLARCGTRPERKSDESIGKRAVKHKDVDVVPDCPWRLYATVIDEMGTFQVKSLIDEHTCARNFKYGKLINYKWIGKQFGHKIRQNPDIKLCDLADLVLKKYKCQVTKNQCSRARNWAVNNYEKSIVDHYGMLWAYGDELLKTNPSSTVKLAVTVNPDEQTYFDKFYICLHGLKEGWKLGCRRIIGLDGCFLKTICQGQILTAIGKDGNNHIFPVAWAVVNVENKENWEWFLRLLVDDLDMPQGNGLTLMSDQHKGLIEAVKIVMPHAEHRQCARHIYENFKKVFGGVEFRRLFWAASKASYPQLFNKIMDEIKAANPNAHKYLQERNPKSWSRAFFEVGRGCDSIENGFSECFNAMIVSVRSRPIITMLEAMRVIVMERMNTMREAFATWHDDLCPSIRKKVECLKEHHRFWHVIPAGGNMFEVRQGEESFDVDESSMTCTCRLWQLSGLPCPHAMAVIFKINRRPEDYVPCWFKRENYMKAYLHYLKPVSGMDMWKKSNSKPPLPPKPKRMPGRPKKKRVRQPDEGGRQQNVGSNSRISKKGIGMSCHKCGKMGHNVRSCKEEQKIVPEKEPKKPGRPRSTTASHTSTTEAGSSGSKKTQTRGGRLAKPGTRRGGSTSGTRSRIPFGFGVFTDPATGQTFIGTSSGVPVPLREPVIDEPLVQSTVVQEMAEDTQQQV